MLNVWFAVCGLAIAAALVMAGIVGRSAVTRGLGGLFPKLKVGPVNSAMTTLFVVGAVVIIRIAVGLWGSWGTHSIPSQLPQSPSLKTVWENVREYWLWIVLIISSSFVLLYFIPKNRGAAERLQGVLVVLVLMLFIVAPVGAWIASWGNGKSSPQVCLPLSSTEAHSCLITKQGVPINAGEPTHPGEFEVCVIRPEQYEYESKNLGRDVFLFKSASDDSFTIQYKLIKPNELVDGKCPVKF